jgi:SAM-dependent methyltransferase
MIRVLSSWEDLGASIERLQPGNSYHADPLKNWDLSQIVEMIELLPRSVRILDAGCSESQCSVLRCLRRKGFQHLDGMDLHISTDDRIQQAYGMLKERRPKPPFRLWRGDITATKFDDAAFNAIVCLSVIEHGLEIRSFLKEMNRILKPGGVLYISTDYWPEKIESGGVKPWGLDWTVFCHEEIAEIVRAARDVGLTAQDPEIPKAGVPLVKWSGRAYTFLSMVLTKR